MSSQHLYDAIVVRALCWSAVTSNRGTSMYRVMEVILFLLILLSDLMKQTTAVCPPWFIPDNSSRNGCSCHKSHLAVKCGKNSSLLQFGYCMTYNSATERTEYGPCPYIRHFNKTAVVHKFYIQLPENVSLLNEFMCGPLNREGTLCGKCKDGCGIALYSYTLGCSKCWGHGYGWVLYYFLELFPMTVMYFLVVIFHIRATSSPLSALVFMSQIVVYTIRLNVPLHMYIENEVTGFLYLALKVLLVLCGIWSLDFFRAVIPPFCISSNIKTVHALALEYVVAFYPVCLVSITYVCIKLHDNNFRPVVWLWKPFHRHFVHLRRRWDSKASIINAFTTFLLLSFSKILFVSFTLFYTLHVRDSAGAEKKYVLYYDPTVEVHSEEYIAFATLAGCVLALFVVSPTALLILYPTRLFRRCVSRCGFRRWHALHMFVESFQGQYKDGTNGTRDFRMVSATFLVLRILTVASFINRYHSDVSPSGIQCALFVCATCLYAILRPYKSNSRNNADFTVLVVLVLMSLVFLVLMCHPSTNTVSRQLLISILLISIPHLVLMCYICYDLAKKAGITQHMKKKYHTLKTYTLPTRCRKQAKTNVEDEAESDTGSLPDRLINPEEYEPVLTTAGKHTAAETTESTEPAIDPGKLIPVYTYGSFN